MTTAACPFVRSAAVSSSSPTRKMKTSSPSWLSVLSPPRLVGGKSQVDTAGAIHPSSDGPSATPASISPTTRGCPTRDSSAPASRERDHDGDRLDKEKRHARWFWRLERRPGEGRGDAARSRTQDGEQPRERHHDQAEVGDE